MERDPLLLRQHNERDLISIRLFTASIPLHFTGPVDKFISWGPETRRGVGIAEHAHAQIDDRPIEMIDLGSIGPRSIV